MAGGPTKELVSGRILLVEDAIDARFLLTEILKSRGYEVDDVGSAHSALKQIVSSSYDLIILDRGLPDLTGNELLAALRSHPRTRITPILFVTGYGEVESQVEALRAGADDYIVKPYEPEVLLARVAVHLRVSQQAALLARQHEELEDAAAQLMMRSAEIFELDRFRTGVLRSLESENTGDLLLEATKDLATSGDVGKIRKRAEAIGRLAEKLHDLVAQQTYYDEVRAALRHSAVLVVSSEPRRRAFLRRAMLSTSATAAVVDDSAAVLVALEKRTYNALMVDEHNLDVIPKAIELQPNIKVLLTTPYSPFSLDEKRLRYLSLGKAAVLARTDFADPSVVQEILTTTGKLLSGEIFGLEKYFGWGAIVHERELRDSTQIPALEVAIRDYASGCGVGKVALDKLHLFVDELTTYAFDAAVDGRRPPLRVRYGTDGKLLGVSVIDELGRFGYDVVYSYLRGGGGLGLRYNMVSALVINVDSGHRTEVIGLLNLLQPPELGDEPHSFSYFSKDGN